MLRVGTGRRGSGARTVLSLTVPLKALAASITALFANNEQGAWYDPTLTHGTQTNLLLNSEDFNKAPWSPTGGGFALTPVSNVQNPEGGYTGVNRLVVGNYNGQHYTTQTATVEAGQVYTYWAMVKKDTRSIFALWAGNPNSGGFFNLDTLTTSNYNNGTNATIVDQGGGWYLCYFNVTPSGTSLDVEVHSPLSMSTLNMQGDDGATGLYVYGLQLEKGSVPTVYQRTADTWAASQQLFSTMFQDSTGTTPVTAVGQPVGMILDKRKGLVRGPEQVAVPYSINTDGLWSTDGSTITRNGNLGNWASVQLLSTTSGNSVYELTFNVSNLSGDTFTVALSGSNVGNIDSNGFKRFIVKGGLDVLNIIPWSGNSAGTGTISNISVRELAGNHASQPTAASRAILQQDSSGCYYLAYDGVDDFYVTPSIDFTGTDKMTVIAGVRKNSDEAVGMLLELSANANGNNGAFWLAVPVSTSALNSFLSKGTSASEAYATVSAPVTAVVTGQGDIGGNKSTIRWNGVQTGSSTGSQGGGTYGNYPLYIGRRGGTSLPFNGREYGLIIRGAQTDDVSGAEKYMAFKTGVTLP